MLTNGRWLPELANDSERACQLRDIAEYFEPVSKSCAKWLRNSYLCTSLKLVRHARWPRFKHKIAPRSNQKLYSFIRSFKKYPGTMLFIESMMLSPVPLNISVYQNPPNLYRVLFSCKVGCMRFINPISRNTSAWTLVAQERPPGRYTDRVQ